MFLKEKIETLIEQSWEYERQALLDHACECLDWFMYYGHDIKAWLKTHGFTPEEIQWVECCRRPIARYCLETGEGIFSVDNEFCIMSVTETEVYLEDILPVPVPAKIAQWVNYHTDLYTNDSGNSEYGYTTTDSLNVVIDAGKLRVYINENMGVE